jgi:parafibromin
MDILKKVFRDPSVCQILLGEVSVAGKQILRAQTVKFTGTETKEYTLEQVLFYLMNRTEKYTTYMSLCRERGIGKIYYTDQKIIIEEIENFKEATVSVEIDGPEFRYIGQHDYGYLESVCRREGMRGGFYYMVVPQSVSSPVNLSNIREFLDNGRCLMNVGISEANKIEIKFMGYDLVVVDDVKGFTSEDWRRVVCIILDGSKWQINEWSVRDLAEIFDTIPTFYLSRGNQHEGQFVRSYNVREIQVRNGAISKVDLDVIQEKVRGCVLNK